MNQEVSLGLDDREVLGEHCRELWRQGEHGTQVNNSPGKSHGFYEKQGWVSLRCSLQVRLAFTSLFILLGHQSARAWGTLAVFKLASVWPVVFFRFLVFSQAEFNHWPLSEACQDHQDPVHPTSTTLLK